MRKYSFHDSGLTKEKNIWDIYKGVRLIRPGNIQVFIIVACLIFLGLNAIFAYPDTSELLESLKSLSLIGFNLCIATLGFLITGFTIFTTLSKPDMLLSMMEFNDKETGLPFLKKILFSFLKVFINYLYFALLFGLVVVFGSEKNLINLLFGLFPDVELAKDILFSILYVFVGVGLPHLVLMLKAYVYNMYAVVMMSLRWEYKDRLIVYPSTALVAVLYEMMKDGEEVEGILKSAERGLLEGDEYASIEQSVRSMDINVLRMSFKKASELVEKNMT